MKNKTRGLLNKGFTLIEMLVVIAIIGILATLIIFSVMGTRQKAGATKAKADMAQLKSVLEKASAVDGCTLVTITASGNAASLNCANPATGSFTTVQAPPYGTYTLNVNGCTISNASSSTWRVPAGCGAGVSPSTYIFSSSGFSGGATYTCNVAGCSCSSGNCDTY